MTRTTLTILGAVLILSNYCVMHAFAQCLDRPDIATLTRTYAGKYLNDAYGFSVQIPRNLVGRDVNNPLYQRGFTIVFDDPDESISVYADVNSLEWQSVDKAAMGYAGFFTKDQKVQSATSEQTDLGGRRAIMIETRFLCHKSSTRYASILIVTLSLDRRFIYSLRWEGRLEEEDGGRKILKSLVSSWRFREPKS